MDTIYLYVVDTAAFLKGVFVRAMDLVRIFHSSDTDLRNFEGLRTKKHRELTGSYYFGEYLSQGALKIEGSCRIISAQAMIDHGLLLPPKGTPWAEKVVSMRDIFYLKESPDITETGICAALDIVELFKRTLRLPLAANLLELVLVANVEQYMLTF